MSSNFLEVTLPTIDMSQYTGIFLQSFLRTVLPFLAVALVFFVVKALIFKKIKNYYARMCIVFALAAVMLLIFIEILEFQINSTMNFAANELQDAVDKMFSSAQNSIEITIPEYTGENPFETD